MLAQAIAPLPVSPRAYQPILKAARTIADDSSDERLVGLFLRRVLLERFGEELLVTRFCTIRKAENLKTIAITDDPKLQLAPLAVGGRNLVEVRQTRLLIHGAIDGRRPAA